MFRFLLCFLLVACSGAAYAQDLTLPFKGRWFVMQGGDTPNVNHHMSARAQWYGIDFAKVGGQTGRALTSTPAPDKLEHFYSWNEPVLAPIDGKVIAVANEHTDNVLGVKDEGNPLGNHIVIEAGERMYVFLAHLQKGSVSVKVDDRVTRGQQIARVGNSGNSDFPHLHLHVQDQPAFNRGNGLNPMFVGIHVELNGKVFENVTWPLIRGLFVSAP